MTPPHALFDAQCLPFPPVPPHLAAMLVARAPAIFSTRELGHTPYDLRRFAREIDSACGDYAVVGFDGHGINSWAVHCYVVSGPLALFIQLPWGGAYLDVEPARAEIVRLFEWAAVIQDLLERARQQEKIAQGWRLTVVASRFADSGWRWLVPGQAVEGAVWNTPEDMTAAIRKMLEELLEGKQVLRFAP